MEREGEYFYQAKKCDGKLRGGRRKKSFHCADEDKEGSENINGCIFNSGATRPRP